MSYLQQQINNFNSSVVSSAGRLPQQKRIIGNSQPPTSNPGTPGPARRHEPANVVYSQPADTGTGKDIMTNVLYAIQKMKEKNAPLTFEDIVGYLSLQDRRHDQGYVHALRSILQVHDKVNYDPTGADGKGTFSFRPPHNIRSEEQLLQKLQSQTTMTGILVKDLKEGWPGVEQIIDKLERDGKLLVTRNKKDNHPKMVWANDPSLMHKFDDEFRQIWEKTKIPDHQQVIEELEKAGMIPTNKNKVVKPRPKVEQKKTKKPRRTGKTTNTHMMGILRDYSHLKR
ncbi:transcription initiation factor TFIIE, beta subunit, putative [Talaromyces stipitatus ATCC 10500]|uniref:Transcription initiation factor IIE subunit beta n=1 Tax=Talaromyces stipitatus (strain ATCC 10500 / CBS 375.48 / QM 6759 / NRRL 1006) TaxID=441959 RepID=B8MAI5_TALSN|nr:transcription initiation factor TFIIE, beta subunit, putative [Talaromyces stipitatus ATCC 10500]EED17409.1 transcription initiation factor TFIIE, beta subunit, putative [Talaromyces stipitatus ATCC 10500]